MHQKFPIFLVCLLLMACSTQDRNGKALARPFSTDCLEEQQFLVTTNRDTVLHTKGGAILHFPAGSIRGDGAVAIRVQEAYTLTDIVRAGLLTHSGAKTLRSGGMINVRAANGAQLQKNVEVSIPADSVIGSMQVYRGKPVAEGIDWIDPKPLGRTPGAVRGAALFQQYCASCHGIDKPKSGPALRDFRYTEEKPWHSQLELYKFLHYTKEYTACHDYTRRLQQQYGALMPSFPQLTTAQIDDITEYISPYFSQERDRPDVAADRTCFAQCAAYLQAEKQVQRLNTRREMLVAQNETRVKYTRRAAPPSADTVPGGTIPKVTPGHFQAQYYTFSIESFGWYNIDELYNVPNSVETDFVVHIDQTKNREYNVFIAIPQFKVFNEGGRLDGQPDAYGFLAVDGKLPIPLGTDAIVFAIGEQHGQILFGYKRVNATEHNDVQLSLTAMDRPVYERTFAGMGLDRVTNKVADTKNAAGIRNIDDSIRYWREKMAERLPAGCDCAICPSSDSLVSER